MLNFTGWQLELIKFPKDLQKLYVEDEQLIFQVTQFTNFAWILDLYTNWISKMQITSSEGASSIKGSFENYTFGWVLREIVLWTLNLEGFFLDVQSVKNTLPKLRHTVCQLSGVSTHCQVHPPAFYRSCPCLHMAHQITCVQMAQILL